MRRRTDAEQVENRVFAVSVPARTQETRFGFPAVREQQRIAVQHPAKVDSLVDLRGEPGDFRIVRKALAYCENSAEQKRGVNRGNLAVPATFAGSCIDPVVKPATLMKRAVGEVAQCHPRAFPRQSGVDPTAFGGDAKSREAEASGRNAANVLVVFVQR